MECNGHLPGAIHSYERYSIFCLFNTWAKNNDSISRYMGRGEVEMRFMLALKASLPPISSTFFCLFPLSVASSSSSSFRPYVRGGIKALKYESELSEDRRRGRGRKEEKAKSEESREKGLLMMLQGAKKRWPTE